MNQKYQFKQALKYFLGDKCYICGTIMYFPEITGKIDKTQRYRLATIDHLIPISKGGDPLDIGNMRLACQPCNREKGNKLLTK
jgi:5-methylcytosine-specific restriction endonuclease McrA